MLESATRSQAPRSTTVTPNHLSQSGKQSYTIRLIAMGGSSTPRISKSSPNHRLKFPFRNRQQETIMALHLPRNNLGCLGLSIGRGFYIDIYPVDRFGHWSPLQ